MTNAIGTSCSTLRVLSLVLVTAETAALLSKIESHRSTGKLAAGSTFLTSKDTGTALALATKEHKVHDDNDEPMLLPAVFVGGWLNLPFALAGIAYAEMKAHIPRFDGMLWWTFAIIVLMLILMGRRWFDRIVGEDEEKVTSGQDEESPLSPLGVKGLDLDDWKKKADNGDLDMYTCIALSSGRYKVGIPTVKLVPQLVASTVLQLLVSLLLLFARFPDGFTEKALELYPARRDVPFRLAGSILYAYAAYGLLHDLSDSCRRDLLKFFFPRNISWFYELPLIIGEFMNVFVGIVVQGILFVIFTKSRNAEDLTMNCLAVQFLCQIDNELVTEAIREEAIENLKYAMIEWTIAPIKVFPHYGLRHHLQTVVLVLCYILRVVFMVMTVGLTFTFAFANNPHLCDLLRSLEPYPWCLGVDSERANVIVVIPSKA